MWRVSSTASSMSSRHLDADLLVVLLLQLARLLVAGAPATDAEAGDLDLGLRARALLASVRRGRRLRRRWVVVLVVVGGDVSAAPLACAVWTPRPTACAACVAASSACASACSLRICFVMRFTCSSVFGLSATSPHAHDRPRSSARPPPTAGVAENLRLSRAPTKTRWLPGAERSDQVDGWV